MAGVYARASIGHLPCWRRRRAMRLPEDVRFAGQLRGGEGTIAGGAEDGAELKDADTLQARCRIRLRDGVVVDANDAGMHSST